MITVEELNVVYKNLLKQLCELTKDDQRRTYPRTEDGCIKPAS
jgi:hypothetical protein